MRLLFQKRINRQANVPRRRRKFTIWLQWAKGFLVSGEEDHFADQKHSSDEVTKAVRILKENIVTLILTEENTLRVFRR